MSRHISWLNLPFRKAYTNPKSNIVQWFPGHMRKGMNQIQAKLKTIDCIIEIHDARIPFSGRNLRFREIIKLRPHILLLNKKDLSGLSLDEEKQFSNKLHEHGVDTVFYTNLRKQHNNEFLENEILPTVKTLTDSRPRYHREGVDGYNILVIGVPNVGKSTFINGLRSTRLLKKGKATTVGATAGVTRSVLSRIKVNQNPPVFLYDTPGILSPKIPNLETGMRLAACACLPDHLVGEINIADYILFWLNSRQSFDYVDYFKLNEPTDNVLTLLSRVALDNKKIMKIKNVATNQFELRPNNQVAAQIFMNAFRKGDLGKFCLDDDDP